jgi:hypothetical protein
MRAVFLPQKGSEAPKQIPLEQLAANTNRNHWNTNALRLNPSIQEIGITFGGTPLYGIP